MTSELIFASMPSAVPFPDMVHIGARPSKEGLDRRGEEFLDDFWRGRWKYEDLNRVEAEAGRNENSTPVVAVPQEEGDAE